MCLGSVVDGGRGAFLRSDDFHEQTHLLQRRKREDIECIVGDWDVMKPRGM